MNSNDTRFPGTGAGGAMTQDGLGWAADETIDERVLDAFRRWLERMEKAADRTGASR